MKTKTKKTARSMSPQQHFNLMLKSYGLKTPQQVKDRILWHHLRQITAELFGKNPVNEKLRKTFDYQWKLAEAQQNTTNL